MVSANVLRSLLLAAVLAVFALPALAADDAAAGEKVIYETAFSSDPHWTTNSPSSNYWDPATGRYHFSIEPSTGNYAYTTIDRLEGDFSFEYDVIFDRVDDGATFRIGLTGPEMDFNQGPNVFSFFSNGKYDRIMWLHVVTTGSKQLEVNSKSDDELTSGPSAYKGPTVRYDLNKTYHVAIDYVENTRTTTMRVTDWSSGREIWAYFVTTTESIRGMNRVYLGSRGDYGPMYAFARGYIDNIRVTQPGEAPVPTPVLTFGTTGTTAPVTATRTTIPLPTPLPTQTPTPESAPGPWIAALALSLGITAWVIRRR